MSYKLKYYGEFNDINSVCYRIEILLRTDNILSAQELDFDEDALKIEWTTVAKNDTIHSSHATLLLNSISDRRYIDLYTLDTSLIRLDVYREGKIYWSGCLDTELYEEPYSYKQDYTVALTFSDFASLERSKWQTHGQSTMMEIINTCIASSAVNYSRIVKHISTMLELASKPLTLEEITLDNENFYDEEGEALTIREVLSSVLSAFSLHIVQKAGDIVIFDLNAIESKSPYLIHWSGEDATLSADVVYNNITNTFSPYAKSSLISAEITIRDGDNPQRDTVYLSYEKGQGGVMTTLAGFEVLYQGSLTAKSQLQLSNGALYCRFREIYSGSDCEAILYSFRQGDLSLTHPDAAQLIRLVGQKPFSAITWGDKCVSDTIITTDKIWLSSLPPRLRADFKLKLNLDVLFDVRYNPFEAASDYNEKEARKTQENVCNFGYIPVRVLLYDKDGTTVLYHYDNRGMILSNNYHARESLCTWKEGAGQWGDAFLAYYNADDRRSKTGFDGWSTNKQMIGYYTGKLPENWKKIEDAEYIDMPPVSGFIEVQIGSGVVQFDYNRVSQDIFKQIRYLAYKSLSVSVTDKNFKTIDLEDIEDKAHINALAQEALESATIIGTLSERDITPSARGLIRTKNEGDIIAKFKRAGVIDRLERLAIGTLYSQYASRHTVISGSADIITEFNIFADRNTKGKFFLAGETQDIRLAESYVTLVELAQENYKGVEYE